METAAKITKRKKRRTRRFLDDIRNRLRRKGGNYFEHLTQNPNKSCTVNAKQFENHLVTNDRLTLKSMFPNAIRSETITRPVLEEIKQKVHELSETKVNPEKKDILFLRQEYVNEDSKLCIHFHKNNSCTKCGDNKSVCKENFNNDERKSSESMLLFSPDDPINISVPLNIIKSADEENEIIPSPSTVTIQAHISKHQRCKELMNDISSYVSQLASSTNKEDYFKCKIQKLHYDVEQSQKEHIKNVEKRNKTLLTPQDHSGDHLILENPLQYIKLKNKRENSNDSAVESLSDRTSSGEVAQWPVSPCGAVTAVEWPVSTYASPHSLHSSIIPFDTPDYNYYPHRLK